MTQGATGTPAHAQPSAHRLREVSVLVTLYNLERWIWAALASIVADAPDATILVVNDGSRDDSASVVRAFQAAHPHVSLTLIDQANAGVCAALNTGLARVSTPFLRFLDADDEFVPGSTARLLARLAGSPDNVACVYGDRLDMDLDGTCWRLVSHAPRDRVSSVYRDALLRKQPHIFMQGAIYRTEAVRAVEGFDTSLGYQDVDFLFRLHERYELRYLAGPAFRYRAVPGSVSSASHSDPRHVASRLRAYQKQRGGPRWTELGDDAWTACEAACWRVVSEYALMAGDAAVLREATARSLEADRHQPKLRALQLLSHLGSPALQGFVVPAIRAAKRVRGKLSLRHIHGIASDPDRSDWALPPEPRDRSVRGRG